MIGLLLLGCSAGPDSEVNDPWGAYLCPWGEERGTDPIAVQGFLYASEDGAPLGGAKVSACREPNEGTLSNGEGNWSLSLPDRGFVVVDQTLDGRVPNRCVFDPRVEGTEQDPYRIGMGTFDTAEFPIAALGIYPVEGLSWVDVDALDLATGRDLPGTSIDITAPYEAAVSQEADGTFVLSNTTTEQFDVIFANVERVPFEVRASHPDKEGCIVPPKMVGEGTDQLNLSVYCY